MGSQQSAEEIKQEFLDSFPNESGLLGYYLWNDINQLHLDWKNYRSLYGTDQETIDLLNEFAPSFFNSLERILRHEIILSIGRLTDPPYSGRGKNKPNASLKKLHSEINNSLNDRQKEVEQELAKLDSQTKKIRDLRNQLIAHSDLPTKLELRKEPLKGVSRAEIEDILLTIRTIFNLITEEFKGSTTYFEGVISMGDSSVIVNILNDVKKKEEERYRKLKGD